jgi:hypothetical protein
METVVSVLLLLALCWAAWEILYMLTASLPGCTERVFMVFYRRVGGRKALYSKVVYTTLHQMSLRSISMLEDVVQKKYGGTVSVTGFHLLEERNVFLRRAWAVLARACLWFVSKALCPLLRRVRRAWAWVSVMWTRTEDDMVAEYERQRSAEQMRAETSVLCCPGGERP